MWTLQPSNRVPLPRRRGRHLACLRGFSPRVALVLSAALTLSVPLAASAKIRIVASIPDLGSIASSVGGDRVEVAAIARASSDAHRVEVLPSYMVRVSRAQLYLKVGLGLDSWADQIIDGSHNGKLVTVDCSRDIDPLERPTGRVDASMGDVHPDGNPHYWLDPTNGAIVARTIAETLSREDPGHAAEYARNAEVFAELCGERAREGRKVAASLPVREVITYHRSWTYLARAFGLEVVGEVEPFPGIPPTMKHLHELVQLVEARSVPALLVEPYFSDDAGDFLARETGVRLLQVSPSCDDAEAGSYLAHFDRIIELLASVTRSAPDAP